MADQENQEILRNLHQALQPIILKLRDRKTRASALSSLANHLHQLVTNEEAEMFNTTCIFLFCSDQTMGVLEEDVTKYITLLEETLNLSPGSYRRLMNILYIFKCMAVAATYPDLVLNGYCNHLPRMIAFFDEKVPESIREDIRESALLTFLAFTGRAPPEILLHIFRCYDLLRTIRNGLAALKDRSLSPNLMQAAAHTMLQDHPEIRTLIGQVLRYLAVED